MVAVMTFNIFFAALFWDLSWSADTDLFVRGVPTDKARFFTILFDTFIFMQIFNEFNCRIVDPKNAKIWTGLFSNFYFLGVVLGSMVL
jgi:magnesium-transporting ATPase (P-type)